MSGLHEVDGWWLIRCGKDTHLTDICTLWAPSSFFCYQNEKQALLVGLYVFFFSFLNPILHLAICTRSKQTCKTFIKHRNCLSVNEAQATVTAPWEGCEVLWWACLFVCLSARVTRKPHGRTSSFLHVACGRGSVLIWRRCVTLCTSGFTDNITFSYHEQNQARRYV